MWGASSDLQASEGMAPCLCGTRRPLGFSLKLLCSFCKPGQLRTGKVVQPKSGWKAEVLKALWSWLRSS